MCYFRMINWPDFNIIVSRNGEACKKEKEMGGSAHWSGHNTPTIFWLNLLSYMGVVCGTPKITIATSKTIDHRSPQQMKVTMKKSEIL